MKNDKAVAKESRRDFLKFAGVGTVAAGASLAVGAEPAKAEDVPATGRAGYRETAHVKKYYELARF